eukprot:g32913.t1
MWHHSSFRLKLLKLMDFLGLKALQRWTSTEGETATGAPRKNRPAGTPVDAGALALVGAGIGSAVHGFYGYSFGFCIWAVLRSLRNLQYIGRVGDKDWEQAHDADLDHSPETLFDLAMSALAAHPRVHEWLGTRVRPMAEPEHVLYRLHEGVTETFLAWQVKGELGEAEVQVKSTGSIVDFIYVFPEGRDHYGLQPPGFVIRPNGDTWSQDRASTIKLTCS